MASVAQLTATASRVFAGDDPITSTSSSARAAASADLELEGTTAGVSPENTGNSAVGMAYSDNHLKVMVVSSGLMALAVIGGGLL